jgi:hypothetical protein
MVYKAARLREGEMLSDEESERFVSTAIASGIEYPNANNRLDMAAVVNLAKRCDTFLSEAYEYASEDFRVENENRCDVQQRSATDYCKRRAKDLEQRIERFIAEGKKQMVPPTEGLIRKVKSELDFKLKKIEISRLVDESFLTLALGVIQVE